MPELVSAHPPTVNAAPQEGGALAAGPRAERLGGLLQDLLASRGRFRTSELLGISERTLRRATQQGQGEGESDGGLTEQRCRALERYEAGLLESGAQSVDAVDTVNAVDHAQELARLSWRLDRLDERVRVQHSLSDDLPEAREALARLEASLEELRQQVAKLAHMAQVAQTQPGGDGGRPAASVGALPQAVPPTSSVRASAAPLRRYPELVTVEAEAEEERFYGAAIEVIAQWRLARLRRKQAAATTGSRLERLQADERLLELELALVGKHGLTLPPADRP